MDVNNTKFHLINGRSDWEPLIKPVSEGEPDLWWDDERHTIGLRPRLFRFPTSSLDEAVTPADRRGAGCDRYGNWYWLAENGQEIWFWGHNGRSPELFWSVALAADNCQLQDTSGAFQTVEPPAITPLNLRGLAVTDHHYLVVGMLEPKGLLIFDLHAGGSPLQIHWPEAVDFAPLDLAPGPDSTLFILDETGQYWQLDRYFRVITDQEIPEPTAPAFVFQPVDDTVETGEHTIPTTISGIMASPLNTEKPIAIESLPDGTVIILDTPETGNSTISRYRFGQQLGDSVPLTDALASFLEDVDAPPTSARRGHDIAFVADPAQEPDNVQGTLFLVTAEGNQAFALRLLAEETTLTLTLVPQYLPIRLYGGKALVAHDGTVYYDDKQERWLPLAAQPRPRYRLEGNLETAVFDGKEPDCVWHRLLIDGRIPPDTAVIVECRAANDLTVLAQMPWHMEPRLYNRHTGSELPFHHPFSDDETNLDGVGTWELLMQQAVGRYAQLRLTIRGNGRATPRLRALRLYYPRFSYLRQYLPDVYQYDEISASFTDRFLANVEGSFTTLEGSIAQVQMLLDVDTTHKEYLEWLADWFGVILDPDWDEARRRLFLRYAIDLFRQRGTPAGLLRALRLALDPCPDDSLFTEDVLAEGGEGTRIVRNSIRLVEQYLTRSRPGVVYGDPTDLGGVEMVSAADEWTPSQGSTVLHERWRTYLKELYPNVTALNNAWGKTFSSFTQVVLSPVVPQAASVAADWLHFMRDGIGFTYADVTKDDEPAYQAFLARRYQRISKFKEAYALSGTQAPASFATIKLPAENDFPADGVRLFDWIQFASLVLPIRRSAHRFSVLVPTTTSSSTDIVLQELALVNRIVNIEKPAHTSFEVKPYWALFRVGEVRLGMDTLLDVGSRFVALILGHSYLAEGYLGAGHPWNVTDRIVTGRNRPGESSTL